MSETPSRIDYMGLVTQFLIDELLDDTEERMLLLLKEQIKRAQPQSESEENSESTTSSKKRKITPPTNCTKERLKEGQKRREKLRNRNNKNNLTHMEISNTNNNGGAKNNVEETQQWPQKVWEFYTKVKQNSPLIHCITNWVSMDLMANTLLAVGASPAMIHSAEEIPDFTPQAHALVINVGTLSATSLPAMKSAAVFATRYRKPWVLDPVAAGSSGFRLRACLDLVELRPTVIRGNGSEIIALSNASAGASKGVDSLHESVDALAAAKSLAQTSGAIVAVSGAVDIITDGQKVTGAHNGVPMMQKITSTGCSVTALIAAYVAVDPTHAFEATASALSVFGIAGELGMETAKGPASLRMNLIDSLYGLDEATVQHHVKVSPLS